MRTTIQIDDELLTRTKRIARSRRTTLGAVIEEALRESLARKGGRGRTKPVKLTTFRGKGVAPGIDLNDTAALLDAMDGPRVST